MMSKLNRPKLNNSGLTAELRKVIARRSVTSNAAGPSPDSLPQDDPKKHDSMATTALSTAKDQVPSESDSIVQSGPPLLDVPLVSVPQDQGVYHLNDLLKFDDVDFIDAAYAALLKRKPDRVGYDHYLRQLREGHVDKIDILATLRFSPEGELRNVRVEGLAIPNLLRRLGHLPFVGYFIRLSVDLIRLPVLTHRWRRQEAKSLAQHRKIADYLNNDLTDYVSRLSTMMEDLSRRLEAINQEQELAGHQGRLLTDQHHAMAANLGELGRDFNTKLETLESGLDRQTERQSSTESGINDLRTDLEKTSSAATELLAELKTRIGEIETLAKEANKELAARTDRIESDAKQTQAETARIWSRIERLYQQLQQSRAALALQGNHLSLIIEEARKRLPTPLAHPQLEIIAAQEQHTLDALYAEIEDNFRGSPDEIKQRFTFYLPLVESLGANAERPIVDLGCGRGEWLELLREAGFSALGIDTNRVFLNRCRKLGLDVRESDGLAYLRGLADDSVSAVTGFHIIEHLRIDVLIRLLDEIVRVLQPGGAVIFETPNPENVLVGSNYFYFDPTHRNPMPSLLMKLLLESRGFHRIEVTNLHPADRARLAGDNDLTVRFNELFYGPMDYAITARKVSE